MTQDSKRQTAILIGVWATFALDVFSSLDSSPQTTELFADARKDTLLHWILIGSVVAIGGGIGGSFFSGDLWPALSAIAVAIGMYGLYQHALKRGAGQVPPGQTGVTYVR